MKIRDKLTSLANFAMGINQIDLKKLDIEYLWLQDWFKKLESSIWEIYHGNNIHNTERAKHFLSYFYSLFTKLQKEETSIYRDDRNSFEELEYIFNGVKYFSRTDVEDVFNDKMYDKFPKIFNKIFPGKPLINDTFFNFNSDSNHKLVEIYEGYQSKYLTSNLRIISLLEYLDETRFWTKIKSGIYTKYELDYQLVELSQNEILEFIPEEARILTPNRNSILYPHEQIYSDIFSIFIEHSREHNCKICEKFSKDYIEKDANIILRQSFDTGKKSNKDYDEFIEELAEHSYILLNTILHRMKGNYCNNLECAGCDYGCKADYLEDCDECKNEFCEDCIITTYDGSMHKPYSICRECKDYDEGYSEAMEKMDELHGSVEDLSIGTRLGGRDLYDTRTDEEKPQYNEEELD